MKRKRPGWERPRPRLLAARRLSSRGRGCPRPFHELALTDTGAARRLGIHRIPVTGPALPKSIHSTRALRDAPPLEGWSAPGSGPETGREKEGKKPPTSLQQACNLPATCLQPWRCYGAAMALLWRCYGAAMALLGSCERVPLAARLGRRRIGIYPCQRQPSGSANSVMGRGQPRLRNSGTPAGTRPAPTWVAS